MNNELHRLAAWFFGGVIVLWLAAMIFVVATAKPPEDGRVAVLFPPSTTDEQAIAAITRSGARPIGQGWLRRVWAVDLDDASGEGLEAAGAMLVIGEFPFVAALGCAGASYQPAAFRPVSKKRPAR